MKSLPFASSILVTLTLGCASTEVRASVDSMQDQAPDWQEMMEACQRAGTPGAEHKALDVFAGTWKAHVKMWMDPAAAAQESEGQATTTWILDGHYLKSDFDGDMGGQAFHGESVMGYDVAARNYVGFWIDSMSTCFMTSTGHASADGKTFTFDAVSTDPMAGGLAHFEETLTLQGPDRHTMVMSELRGDERVKLMEIEYDRVR